MTDTFKRDAILHGLQAFSKYGKHRWSCSGTSNDNCNCGYVKEYQGLYRLINEAFKA